MTATNLSTIPSKKRKDNGRRRERSTLYLSEKSRWLCSVIIMRFQKRQEREEGNPQKPRKTRIKGET